MEQGIRAVVFDFGGVIGDFDLVEIRHFLETSLELSEEESKGAIHQMNQELKFGGSDRSYWEQYAASRGHVLPPGWFDQYQAAKRHAFHLMPGTLATVCRLRTQGYRVAMLSNTNPDHANVIAQMGYYDFFCPVLLSYRIGTEKPDPRAYHILLQKLNLPPESVVFIDNTPENVEAAEKLGIHGILFTDAPSLRKSLKRLLPTHRERRCRGFPNNRPR